MNRLVKLGVLILIVCGLIFSSCTSSKPTMPKEEVRSVVRGSMRAIRGCYTRFLNNNSEKDGKLILQWHIMPSGDVGEIQVVQSIDKELDECVSRQISLLKFTKPPKGVMPIIEYPFEFSLKK